MTTATTIVPNQTGARLLTVTWLADQNRAREITSPILAWEVAPDREPRPVTLMGDPDRLAWAVIAEGGLSFVPGEAVYLARELAVRDLTARAKKLAGVDP
jgi:hypothetical protein